MLVFTNKVFDYIRVWLDGMREKNNKSGFTCVITGGVDSCVAAALCLNASNNKPTTLIFMGFKVKQEAIFEKWVETNFAANRYKIIKPSPVKIEDPQLQHINSAISLIPTYIDLYSKLHNTLTVGAITRSEYNMVKLFRNRIDTLFDSYPIIDLYKSEIKELAGYMNLSQEIIEVPSITEDSFGHSYSELEWLDRENENLNLISSLKKPTSARHWALLNDENKRLALKVYRLNKENEHLKISNEYKCFVRKALPGWIS